MKKNKKPFVVLGFLVAVLLGAAVCFAGCGQTPEPDETEKTYITYDATKKTMTLTFDAVEGAERYEIERGGSRLGEFGLIGQTASLTYTDPQPNLNKYQNYYKVTALRGTEALSEKMFSLELQLFGENMRFYDAEFDETAAIGTDIQSVYTAISGTDPNVFGAGEFVSLRNALYFKPGDYSALPTVNVGFYTHGGGLGGLPSDTLLKAVKTPPERPSNGALCNFWRSIENLSVSAGTNTFNWGVSQAAPARRIYAKGTSVFDMGGAASGGFAADCYFADSAGSGSQQQYYTRNNYLAKGLTGINWNNFMQGNESPVSQPTDWATGGKNTHFETTPVIREKPFLFIENGEYKVFVPALRKDATGTSWDFEDMGAGIKIGISDFYVAKASVDTAESLNKALSAGKHLFFTPGNYFLKAPVHITRKDTVVLGTGYATLIPGSGNTEGAMLIGDVDNVTVAGLMFDAHYSSKYLLRAGEPDSAKSHALNPTLLSDLFFRIGGVLDTPVNADVALQINSNDVISDHSWIWRADHGYGTDSPTRQLPVAWDKNTSKNGLIVSGDNVTAYGLFVEHFQEYQTLWLGENGKTYFYQCETPYDPFDQSVYLSRNGTTNGYSAYKVGNNVKTHFAAGLGIYECFSRTGVLRDGSEEVHILNAAEVPDCTGVVMQNICTVGLTSFKSEVDFIINGTGDPSGNAVPKRVVSYSNGVVVTASPNKTGIAPPDEVFHLPR